MTTREQVLEALSDLYEQQQILHRTGEHRAISAAEAERKLAEIGKRSTSRSGQMAAVRLPSNPSLPVQGALQGAGR